MRLGGGGDASRPAGAPLASPRVLTLGCVKGQRTALIPRDVSAATLECKESNCCPKFGVCASVCLGTHTCLCTHTHFCAASERASEGEEREADRDYR